MVGVAVGALVGVDVGIGVGVLVGAFVGALVGAGVGIGVVGAGVGANVSASQHSSTVQGYPAHARSVAFFLIFFSFGQTRWNIVVEFCLSKIAVHPVTMYGKPSAEHEYVLIVGLLIM